MANAVIMPKQGQSVESCVITKWHKSEGDKVSEGEILFSYETDKAAFDEESKYSGTILAILAQEGDDVPCLNYVCIIGEPGEDISDLVGQPSDASASIEQPEEKIPEQAPNIKIMMNEAESAGKGFASPRARLAAQRQNVDALNAVPTGPGGRIIERDIYALSAQTQAHQKVAAESIETIATVEAAYTDMTLSSVRKAIAKAMHRSLSSMAQLTHHSSFDASRLLALRRQIKENKNLIEQDITLNDMLLFAVSRVLKNHPDLNAHFLDDKMRVFHSVNLGIAVDTSRGLLVPTLFGADKLSLREISKQAKKLIEAAQSGSINPELLSGGTFTVTNLGSLGVEGFTPVINPPQTGILGVCAIVQRIREQGGTMSTYPAMGLSLTYDHRAVDGAPAARFARELGMALENFDLLLAL